MIYVPTSVIYKYSCIFLYDARRKTELCGSYDYLAFQIKTSNACYLLKYIRKYFKILITSKRVFKKNKFDRASSIVHD